MFAGLAGRPGGMALHGGDVPLSERDQEEFDVNADIFPPPCDTRFENGLRLVEPIQTTVGGCEVRIRERVVGAEADGLQGISQSELVLPAIVVMMERLLNGVQSRG
jgi:hypothetical protein